MGRKGAGRPGTGRTLLCLLLTLATLLTTISCGGRRAGTAGREEGAPGVGEEEGAFSFLVCGDPHGRTDLLDRIVSDLREGEFLVVVGDLGSGRGEEELRRMKGFLDAKGIRYHVVPGDNDQPGGDASAFRRVFGPTRYSMDVGSTHLVFINDAVPGVGIPPEDLEWLEGDLAGTRGRRVVAFAHVPPGAPVDISRGFREGESESHRRLKELLSGVGTEVVYSGHLHAYMLYSTGPPRVVVTGGAGARPHVSPEAGGFHHYLRVTVAREITEEVIRL
jgi:hypothetical protein